MSNIDVRICRFKNDALFAFSMTYDEGTVDCLANALPIHERFNIPGHVDVVAGQLGRKRNCYLCSLNDYVHMSADDLKFLLNKGWGVGNHSWSHYCFPASPGLNMFREIVWSKYRLEDEIDYPVRIFTVCNDMYNYESVLDLVKQHYLACVSVEGGPNRESYDFYNIGNCMLASGGFKERPGWPNELRLENLTLDFVKDSWVLLTTHLVMWDVPQSHKCTTPLYLTRYFEKLYEISEGNFWAVKPDDAIDYELMRRNIRIENVECEENRIRFDMNGSWPVGVINSMVTVKISGVSIDPHTAKVNTSFSITSGGFTGHNKTESIKRKGADTLINIEAVPGKKVEIVWNPIG
ncbi:MAG: polysaccharide deacetylase family protein [Clostridiaceae bacterium]|nr:polysaccharide deacetylase family protein [Clostridiaceae bacterium]